MRLHYQSSYQALDLYCYSSFFPRMDPLFTFNSQPLRPPSPPAKLSHPQNTPAFGGNTAKKGKLDIDGVNLGRTPSAVRSRPLRSHSLRREKENRGECEQRDWLDGELGQAAKKGEKKMGGEVDLLTFSFRYSHQLPPDEPATNTRGKSALDNPKESRPRVPQLGLLARQQSMEGDNSMRRRIQSVKMSPRIVVPLSDRKLPRVFKTRQQEYLPPIDVPRKYDSLELRQVKSANRPRCGYLHLFQEQLYQLGAAMLQQPSLVPF